MDVKVTGIVYSNVIVNPVDVLKEISIIPKGDWIIIDDNKYIQMEEESAGRHSFDRRVGEVSKETYELYKAQQLLINYLSSK